MKKPLALLGAALCLAITPANAVLWTGEITGVFSDDCEPFEVEPGEFEVFVLCSLYPPGYTWTATYQYESDTVDGSFDYFSGNARVEGFSLVTSWDGVPLDYPQITVEGGKVTAFLYRDSPAITFGRHPGDEEGFWNVDELADAGPITISDPVAVIDSTSAVPDSDSTLPLASLACLGLTGLRHVMSRR